MPCIIFDFDGTLVDLEKQDPDGNTLCYLTQAVGDLCKGLDLCLVTGSPQKEVERIFLKSRIAEILNFKQIITADDDGTEKRNGKAFSEIQSTYGNVVVVGDGDSDEQGAAIANCRFVRVKKMSDLPSQSEELYRCVKEATSQLLMP